MSLHGMLPLFVVVPLLLAALTVLVRRHAVGAAAMIAVPAATVAGGIALIVHHAGEPVLANSVGGFDAGIAIPFVSDTLAAVMLTVTGLSSAAAAAFLLATGEARYRFAVPLVLMLVAGVNGAILTGDLFNLFVFVEVMLLPSYALIAVTGTWRRLGVGRLFVVVNLVTSTILLIGVGFVYGVTGSVNLASLRGVAAQDSRAALAVAVVLLALAIKAGVSPAHTWLPRTYPATSAGVMALFSGLHTKVALYAIYRVYSVTFDGAAPGQPLLVALLVLTMIVGALSTFGTVSMREALGYQMVAGVGHILIGLAVFTTFSLGAGLLYLVHHVITVSALVLTAGAIEHTYGSGRFDRLSDLMRRDPWIAAVFALGLLSLVGLPPTSGAWGKAGLVVAAAQAGGWLAVLLVGTVLLASVISLVALQRVWTSVFWGPPLARYRADDPRTGRGEIEPLPEGLRIGARIAAPGAVMMALSVAMFVGIGALVPVMQRAGLALTDLTPYVEAVLR